MVGPRRVVFLAVAVGVAVRGRHGRPVDFAGESDGALPPTGACGPPARLGASIADRLYFFAFVDGSDASRVGKFLDYYAARGAALRTPGRAQIVVHRGTTATAQVVAARAHGENARGTANYSSTLKRDAANAFLATLPPRGLLMYPDLDEFFDAAPDVMEAAANATGGWVRGFMVDRISADWALVDAGDVAPWAAFPRRCGATYDLLGGNDEKWVLVPAVSADDARGGSARVTFRNSHRVVKAPARAESGPAVPFSHYRFDAAGYGALLRKRDLYAAGAGPTARDRRFKTDFYDRALAFVDPGPPPRLNAAFRAAVACGAPCPGAGGPRPDGSSY